MLVADQLLPGARTRAGEPGEQRLQPGFAAALMLKDLNLAREAAQSVKANTAPAPRPQKSTERFAQEGHSGRTSRRSSNAFASIIRRLTEPAAGPHRNPRQTIIDWEPVLLHGSLGDHN